MKRCSRCAEEKPLDQFSFDSRASDGRQSACRECEKAAARKRRLENPEAVRAQKRDWANKNKAKVYEARKQWREQNADTVRERKRQEYLKAKQNPEWVAKQKAARDARKDKKRQYDAEYSIANRDRKVRAAQKWAAENRDRRRAITKAYDGRRRAQKRGGISGPDLAKWVEAQRKVCAWCGQDCADGFHVDHVVPLAKGGEHEAHNLAIACPPCNFRKNAKSLERFLMEIGARPSAEMV